LAKDGFEKQVVQHTSLKKSWNGDKTPYRKGIQVIALDEASHIIGWNTQNGWYPVGKPVITPVSLSRKRFHSFGALHRDGFVCWFAERANSESFIAFLEELRKRFGRILVYLDNAGYHKSVVVCCITCFSKPYLAKIILI